MTEILPELGGSDASQAYTFKVTKSAHPLGYNMKLFSRCGTCDFGQFKSGLQILLEPLLSFVLHVHRSSECSYLYRVRDTPPILEIAGLS